MSCTHFQSYCRIPYTVLIESSKLSLLILMSLILTVPIPCFSINQPPGTTNPLHLGSTLFVNQTHFSPNGRFAIGLFSPHGSGGNSFYLGIWYAQVPDQTVVWIANREQPASRNASWSLSLHGELQLLDAGYEPLWSSFTSGLNVNTASLQNTGNLILQTANFTSVWESFQHPSTSIWMPYMRVKRGHKLQSWRSSTNPAVGKYAIEMHTLDYSLVWNNSRPYWNSGPWTGQGFKGIDPTMVNGTIYNFDFNTTTGIVYYPVPNSTGFDNSFVWIRPDGRFEARSWDQVNRLWLSFWITPLNQCAVYDFCGPNAVCNDNQSPPCTCLPSYKPVHPQDWFAQAWSDGCEIESPFKCDEKGTDDRFSTKNQMSFDVSFSLRLTDWDKCMTVCLKNCSCLAFSYQHHTMNCSLVHKVLRNGRTLFSSSIPFYVRVPSVAPSRTPSERKWFRVAFIVGTTLFVALLVLLAVGVALCCIRDRTLLSQFQNVTTTGSLIMFSYRELHLITQKFKEKIGNGAFGTVFKGALPNGTQVAVKKLDLLEHGEKQFRAEVRTIGMIQHINLVRLIGFCCEGKHRLLVYEYVAGGSLDALLFRKKSHDENDEMGNGVLDWSKRFNIALGIARAITYLHEECRKCIIHLDIKPENILVDESFCPKLSDFGLATLMGREFSRVVTTIRGTRGYIAPEWLNGSPITAKADVYSYGMTLLEIISGRRNIDTKMEDMEKHFFPVWAAKQVRKHAVMKLVDERLGEKKVEEEQVRRMAHAALWCIQDSEVMRPCMSKVVLMLEGSLNLSNTIVPPIPHSLQLLVMDDESSPIT